MGRRVKISYKPEQQKLTHLEYETDGSGYHVVTTQDLTNSLAETQYLRDGGRNRKVPGFVLADYSPTVRRIWHDEWKREWAPRGVSWYAFLVRKAQDNENEKWRVSDLNVGKVPDHLGELGDMIPDDDVIY